MLNYRTTTTNAALADKAKASEKDGSEEEAADKTAEDSGFFHKRRTEEVE